MGQPGYTLATEVRGDHLLVRASGVRTRAAVEAITAEVFDTVLANGLAKALIDVRELKGRLGTLDSYYLVTEVFAKLRGKGMTKAAIVDRPPSPIREWFLETVARNRGYNFRMFADERDALEWLQR